MKRKTQIMIGATAAAVLAFSALAQDLPNSQTDRSDDTRQSMALLRSARLNDAAKASHLIGMTVKNYQGEKLGKVQDLGLDVESGRVVQVILSTGGFIGKGKTLTAVPPGALQHDVHHKVLHLDADKEKLTGGPKFEMSNWSECCDSPHLVEVYRHYGEEPSLRFIHHGNLARDGQPNADGATDTGRRSNESGWMIPASRLSHLQKASKVMGTPVKNLQDEKLGKVEDLLVDLPAGRIVAVVVSSGGFLGMRDELSAVPPTVLGFSPDWSTLQLDASKEMLSNAPHFKAKQWPDFGQPSFADGIYRAYRVEPYFTTNVTTEPDNTARNVRDRHEQTLTPLDQGSSKADVNTTARIRKEIIAEKSMSINAKNVKIITLDGRVTLRGPVNSAEEKRLIGEIADRVARSENVDNQLEVRLTTSSNN